MKKSNKNFPYGISIDPFSYGITGHYDELNENFIPDDKDLGEFWLPCTLFYQSETEGKVNRAQVNIGQYWK